MPNAFFIAGNKRSGTSQLVRLLNLHPQIFISHESDAVWIISQFFEGQNFSGYSPDSPRGMDYTLKVAGQVLSRENSPEENFFAVQKCLMEAGSPWLAPMSNKDLRWVGDKKPFQYSDPAILGFIRANFPNAAFIHLVRHPFAVAYSAQKFNRTANGDFWKDLTPEQMVEQWTQNEQNILQLKESGWAKVLDVRYEDLCRQTTKELERIFKFLGVEADQNILKAAAKTTHYRLKKTPAITYNQETKTIMDRYGYSTGKVTSGALKILLSNFYWKVRKQI